jgi:hypothetical protein
MTVKILSCFFISFKLNKKLAAFWEFLEIFVIFWEFLKIFETSHNL